MFWRYLHTSVVIASGLNPIPKYFQKNSKMKKVRLKSFCDFFFALTLAEFCKISSKGYRVSSIWSDPPTDLDLQIFPPPPAGIHISYRQLDFPSGPGVANEILENDPKSCLTVA